MPKFAEKYTDAERARLADYAIRHNTTARRAIQEAESGRLFPNDDGTPGHSYTMPVKTAQDYIARERRARTKAKLPSLARQGLDGAVGTLEQRAIAIADKQLRALEREGAKATPDRAIRAVRLVAELRKLANTRPAPPPPPAGPPSTAPQGTEAPTPGFLDQLAAETAKANPLDQHHPTPTQRETETTTPPATTNPTNAQTPTHNTSGVPSRASVGELCDGGGQQAAGGRVSALELYGDVRR